jgi:regulator of protease activity HflC (stomatin/prohibitin superfamily)
VNTELRVVLDEATGKWGIRINRVEIKSVDPPPDIRTAMEKQMRAERDRRAAILTAEGEQAGRRSSPPRARSRRPCSPPRPRARVRVGDPARRGRSEGDRHGLQSDPRGQTEPGAAELRIPADAAAAGEGRLNKVFVIPSEFAEAFGGIGEALGKAGAAGDPKAADDRRVKADR